jgi:hypothetical protein
MLFQERESGAKYDGLMRGVAGGKRGHNSECWEAYRAKGCAFEGARFFPQVAR